MFQILVVDDDKNTRRLLKADRRGRNAVADQGAFAPRTDRKRMKIVK